MEVLFRVGIEVYIQWTNLEKTSVTHTHAETSGEEVRKCPKDQKRQNSIALPTGLDLNFTSMHFYCAFKTRSGAAKHNWLSPHCVLTRARTQVRPAGPLAGDPSEARTPRLPQPFAPHQGPSRSSRVLRLIRHDPIITSFFFFAQSHRLPCQILFTNSSVSCLSNLEIVH